MSSIINSLYMSKQSLLNNQAALNVVSNNISNMNTEGYSKESINLENVNISSAVNDSALSQIRSANGATISSITRNRSAYLDAAYREASSDTSYAEELANNISDVETYTNELSTTGLTKSLSSFYTQADNLKNNPTDYALRTTYVQSAETVCDKFNSIYDSLTNLKSSLVGDPADPSSYDTSKLTSMISELNKDLNQLANLNDQISKLSSQGQSPNALLDQRDKLLDDISEYIPITVTNIGTNNNIAVSLNGVQLVKGSEIKGTIEIEQGTTDTPSILNITDENGDVVVSNLNDYIDSGSIGAVLDFTGQNGVIETTLNDLDKMAQAFADTLNDIQTYSNGTTSAMCIDNTGTTQTLKVSTLNMIVNSDNTSSTTVNAGNISVSQSIIDNPYEVATARGETTVDGSGNTVPVKPSAVGNADNISAVCDLRTGKIGDLGNSTFTNYLTVISGNVGTASSKAQANYETQEAVLEQSESMKDSKSGVNLDEELVDMIKFQRAYEASAKIFNTANEILQTLINLAR